MALTGKVAIVAGASRGIGADVARELGRAGAKVVVAARTEQQQDPRLPGTIHAVAQEIQGAGGTALPVVMNLRDPESVRQCVGRTVETWGRLDIVINNAAIFVPGTIVNFQDRHLELSLAVNVRGAILMMRAAVPHLEAGGGGHIINFSSRGGQFPGPGPYDLSKRVGGFDIFYGPEKALVEHFSQGQARALQASNISVNVLSPASVINTPGFLFANNDPKNPNLNFETADAMAKSVVWICQQPPQEFTGNIVYDEDVCREHGL